MADRIVTPRRLMEQTLHCVKEALSIYENKEDYRCALDDIEQAQELLVEVKKTIKAMATGVDRARGTV